MRRPMNLCWNSRKEKRKKDNEKKKKILSRNDILMNKLEDVSLIVDKLFYYSLNKASQKSDLN